MAEKSTIYLPEAAEWTDADIFRRVISMLDEVLFADSRGKETTVYHRICRLAGEIASSAGASLFLAESSGAALISVAVWDRTRHVIPGRRLSSGEGVAGSAFRNESVAIHSPEHPHPAYIAFEGEEVIECIAAFPIRVESSAPLGVLCIVNPLCGGEFGEETLRRVEKFAEVLGPIYKAIELTADLYESNRRLRESVDRTARLYSVAVKICDRRPIREVFEEIGQAFRMLFGFEHFGFFLGNDALIELTYADELPAPFAEGYMIGPAIRPPAEETATAIHCAIAKSLAGRRELVEDLRASGRPRGPISCAVIPFESGTKLIGAAVLVRNWEEIQPFRRDELDRCRIFVAQCSLLLDQALELKKALGC